MGGEKNGFNDDDDGLLSGDPTQTPSPATGMDSSFNDKDDDVGSEKQTPPDPSEGKQSNTFNDNPSL